MIFALLTMLEGLRPRVIFDQPIKPALNLSFMLCVDDFRAS